MVVLYSGLEKEIVDRLQPLTGAGFDIVQLPEFEADYTKPLITGRATVAFMSSEAGPTTSTQYVRQEEKLTFSVTIQCKRLRDANGLHAIAEWIKRTLIGFKTSTTDKIYFKGITFEDHDVKAGYWVYVMKFGCIYQIFEDAEFDSGSALQSIISNVNPVYP